MEEEAVLGADRLLFLLFYDIHGINDTTSLPSCLALDKTSGLDLSTGIGVIRGLEIDMSNYIAVLYLD